MSGFAGMSTASAGVGDYIAGRYYGPTQCIPLPSPAAAPQPKTYPGRKAVQLDESPFYTKAPSANLDVSQRIATSGETVPIVFGKRTNDIGGVWVQPSLVKSGTYDFIDSYLYAVSQGEIASAPEKNSSFVGERRIQFLTDQTITMSHIYETAASLAAAPNVCPITGTALFCGIETVSFRGPMIKAQVGAVFQDVLVQGLYQADAALVLGTGETANTGIIYRNLDRAVYRSDTGEDVTDDYNDFFNIDIDPEVVFALGGAAPGTIQGSLDIPFWEPGDFDGMGLNMPTGAFLIALTPAYQVDKSLDPGEGEDTGELYGLQVEYRWSPYEDPTDTPTADNSAYADITFLQIEGDIVQLETTENGKPLKPQQLSIFYPEGAKVDLYSAGLVSGSYTVGPSNQLVDLSMHLFTIYKRAEGAETAEIAAPIYTGNFTDLAAFCNEYALHYNGVLDQSVNIIEFAGSVAPYFFLAFLSIGGQYRFEPVLPLNGSNEFDLTPLTPAATFSEDQILPDSFAKVYKPLSERKPFIAVMLWREADPSKVGIQRTVQVAFSTTALDAPTEQFDLTAFCCDPAHAALYGKYEVARRTYSTHTIMFDTALNTTGLKPMDVIKVERQRITSAGDNRTETEWYQVIEISYGNNGVSTIQAEHFPVDETDAAVISDAIINGSFRVLS